jgi:hypothetical protein
MTALQPIGYDLELLKNDLLALMSQLTERRMRELSWIEMAFARVKYQNPETTSDVRESTRKLAAALCVLYYVVMIEAYFPNTYKDSTGKLRNLWDEIESYGWLSSSELKRLRAYRHVRHSFAHDPEGKRAKQNYSTFTEVMKSANPLPCISYTVDQIIVDTGAGIRMVDEIYPIIQNILSKMLSTPKFEAKPRS